MHKGGRTKTSSTVVLMLSSAMLLSSNTELMGIVGASKSSPPPMPPPGGGMPRRDDDGSDPNDNNDDNRNYDNFPMFQTPQSYSVHQHYKYDPFSERLDATAETEAVTFFSDGGDGSDSGSWRDNEAEMIPPSLPSPLALDTLLCSGGGDPNGSNDPFVAMAECRFQAMGNNVNEDDLSSSEEESDDESDDDGDDGANMMLSNASLKKSECVGPGSSVYLKTHEGENSVNGQEYGTRQRRHHAHTGHSVHESVMAARCWSGARNSVLCPLSASNSISEVRTLAQQRWGRRRYSSSPTIRALSVRGGSNAAAAASSEFVRRLLVAAIVTLLYEALMGHMLEFVKIVMQTSEPGTTYLDVLRLITAEKGLLGIWDGFVPWGVVQAIFKGGVFGLAHAVALNSLMPLAEAGKIAMPLALTLAGGIAGGFQGYVLSPTLLLKTRVMTDPAFRESMSLLRTTMLSLTIGFDVVRQEGLPALMKGSTVFATKRVFDWSTRYFFSDLFASILLHHVSTTTLTPAEKVAADILGGTASTLCTLPLDVLVSKTQDAKNAGVKVSPFTLILEEYEGGGLRRLRDSYLMGFEARLLHVCFTTVAMKTGTALMYDALFKGRG